MIDTGPQGPPAGALAGIVVADFSRVLAAPYATMLFGDLGADVIKIERPGSGDDTRHWGPPFTDDHEATYFLSVNRNKRSFTADMSAAADHDHLVELIRRADVLIENFRPGTMARHGLSYDQMAAINPRLVYCSITGFGSDDAAADLPGYDLLVQAVGGLMSVTGPAPGQPVKAGVALVDVLTGLHAAIGVLAALRARETTGRGQLVEVNLLSTLLSSMVNQSVGYTAAGAVPGILGNRHPSIAPYQLFPASDRPVVIAVGNDRQFTQLCTALGIPEAAKDPRFATNTARVTHIDELDRTIMARTAGQTADHWYRVLSSHGIPCGPVNNIAEAFAMANELGLNARVTVGTGHDKAAHDGVNQDSVDLAANPITLSDTPVSYRRRPPRLGQHADEVRAWLNSLPVTESPQHHSNNNNQPMGAHP
ncbi:crotonobetainyl-CoA:carnitine CoA-transferase CaiB-like acyl-CoA transferase [Arthrobacter pascens]|uniref:CaiB/BaiF CoA transferase family protein n=1 Tax=Arthrobacter pascens TaxID=1677 RepID=UPI00278F4B43|nr:CoA transferase [Arthrobacter pascens]MDQ0678614.1 crotonobetainyl-CoA:carnitine CoA-transferase CaiB-like acyl-CoA transferase [Arthrobacter pascens]